MFLLCFFIRLVIFRLFDISGSEKISKKEFKKIVPALMLEQVIHFITMMKQTVKILLFILYVSSVNTTIASEFGDTVMF